MSLGVRSLAVLGATSACWAFSFGLGSQVVSHWLRERGAGDIVIGLAHSFYYFGLAVASCAVPSLTRRLGTIRCTAVGLVICGITLAACPWTEGELVWYLLRFLNGCGGAFSLVPLETIVSRDSAPERKTLNFGIYGVSLTLGGALGIGTAPQFYPAGYTLTFCVGGGAAIAACIVLVAGLRESPGRASAFENNAALGLIENFLSYGTAWSQGFLEGGMLAFLALFLEARGFSSEAAGSLMAVTMVGVILFQVPVSWFADSCGKIQVLMGCYAVVAFGLATIPWMTSGLWLALVLFFFGACTGAMYPLGLSLLGERMPASALPRAYAWYLAIECVGSQAGAAAMGVARDWWGEGSMFGVGLAIVLAVILVWSMGNVYSRLGNIAANRQSTM